MNRAIVGLLPVAIVVVAIFVLSRLIGTLASLQARACTAIVFLLLLLVGLIWFRMRRKDGR